MMTHLPTHRTGRTAPNTFGSATAPGQLNLGRLALFVFVLMGAVLAGCQSSYDFKSPPDMAAAQTGVAPAGDAMLLREGDILRVTFPGSPNLDTQPQPIRRDGYITLPLINEAKAAGLTPAELEKDLVKRYAKELASGAVSVTVMSSHYDVYVTGAVLRPGKVSSDHPISALEAIMEAGGFDYTRANLKKVTVIRQEGGGTKKYVLNLKAALDPKAQSAPYYLRPADIVYVPERFNPF
jgi:polysaccharide export outer membrane protein